MGVLRYLEAPGMDPARPAFMRAAQHVLPARTDPNPVCLDPIPSRDCSYRSRIIGDELESAEQVWQSTEDAVEPLSRDPDHRQLPDLYQDI